MVGAVFFWLIWELWLIMYFWVQTRSSHSKTMDLLLLTLVYFTGTLAYVNSVIVSCLFILRLWLYYYDWNVNKFNQNKEWRMIIDPINESSIKNWFIKNQLKYGKVSNLIKPLIIIILIEAVSMGIPALIYLITKIAIFVWILEVIIYALIIPFHGLIIPGILVFKIIRECGYDSLGIRNEFILYAIGSAVFSSVSLGGFFHWGNILASVIWIGDFGIRCIYGCFYTIWTGFTICTFVIYPKSYYHSYGMKPKVTRLKNSKKTSQKPDKSEIGMIEMGTRLLKGDSCVTVGNINDSNSISSSIELNTITWTKFISFYDGFEAIMNHLEKEFSMECLLFVQEVCNVM